MGKIVEEQKENTGLSQNAGNASVKNLIKGKLKDKVWYGIVGFICFVLGFVAHVVLF